MKSVVYKGTEYDCHIIDTAGQVNVVFFVTKSSSSSIYRVLIGRVLALELSICHRNSRLHSCLLDYVQKLVQHDSSRIRQNCQFFWCHQDPLRYGGIQV